jgi:hypothetical protein
MEEFTEGASCAINFPAGKAIASNSNRRNASTSIHILRHLPASTLDRADRRAVPHPEINLQDTNSRDMETSHRFRVRMDSGRQVLIFSGDAA